MPTGSEVPDVGVEDLAADLTTTETTDVTTDVASDTNDSDVDVSPGYVKKLRAENERYRQQVRAAEPLLSVLDDESLRNISAAFSDLMSDDPTVRSDAGRWLASVVARQGGAARDASTLWDAIEEARDEAEEIEEDLGRPLTEREAKELFEKTLAENKQKEAQQAQEAEVAKVASQIEDRLKEAGYGANDGKPNPVGNKILAHALELRTVKGENGSFPEPLEALEAAIAAHEQEVKTLKEQAVQEYLDGLRGERSRNPKVATSGAASTDEPEKSPIQMTREERRQYAARLVGR